MQRGVVSEPLRVNTPLAHSGRFHGVEAISSSAHTLKGKGQERPNNAPREGHQPSSLKSLECFDTMGGKGN